MSSKTRTPNDDRAVSLNPNNPAHKAAQDNRSVQLNEPLPAPPAGSNEKGTAPRPPEKTASTTKR